MDECNRNEKDGWWLLMESGLRYIGSGILVSVVLVELVSTDTDRDSGQQIGMALTVLGSTVFFSVLFYYLNALRRKILSIWNATRPGT